MKQVALNVNVNVVLNKILMSQSVFLLFLRYRFFNYNASVTIGSTWKFNRKQGNSTFSWWQIIKIEKIRIYTEISMKIIKQATFIFCVIIIYCHFFCKGRVSIGIHHYIMGKSECLKSGHNFGCLEATDISKFARSPPKIRDTDISLYNCCY